MTVSMTWATPLEAWTSADTTVALAPSALVKVTVVPEDPVKTPAVIVSPPTVSTGPDVTSLDSTLAAIT